MINDVRFLDSYSNRILLRNEVLILSRECWVFSRVFLALLCDGFGSYLWK